MIETFECVCDGCSKVFESEDNSATLCETCWETIVGSELTNEGIGED